MRWSALLFALLLPGQAAIGQSPGISRVGLRITSAPDARTVSGSVFALDATGLQAKPFSVDDLMRAIETSDGRRSR